MTRMNFDKTRRSKLLAQTRASSPDPRFNYLAKEQEVLVMPTKEPAMGLTNTLKPTVMEITPELATKWLEGNVHNRKLRQKEVDRLAREMKGGRWALNGESIIFASDGTLLDGQHRLWACVESQVTFQSVVVYGADASSFTTIDQGRHRSPANHLEVARVQSNYTTTVAAVASIIIRYRTNNIFSNEKVNPADLVELVKTNPEIVEWVNKARKAPKGLKGSASSIATVLYLGSRYLPNEAEAFLHHWVTGSDLATGSPILTLRQRVLTAKPPASQWERLFLVVSAWNAYAEKRPLYKMGSLRGDKFPGIVGYEK